MLGSFSHVEIKLFLLAQNFIIWNSIKLCLGFSHNFLTEVEIFRHWFLSLDPFTRPEETAFASFFKFLLKSFSLLFTINLINNIYGNHFLIGFFKLSNEAFLCLFASGYILNRELSSIGYSRK